MRIDCEIEGITECWIDYSEVWTRRETEQIDATTDEKLIELVQRKIVACHIPRVDLEPIITTEDFTYDNLLDCDEAIWGWLGQTIPVAIARRRILGNASLRLSSGSNGTVAKTPTTMNSEH